MNVEINEEEFTYSAMNGICIVFALLTVFIQTRNRKESTSCLIDAGEALNNANISSQW